MTPTQTYLESLGACAEARDWVGDRTIHEAWTACTRLDWLQWLIHAHILARYDADTALAGALYSADTAALWARYRADKNVLWAQYEADRAPFRARYEADRAPFRARYVVARAAIYACRTCDELRAQFSCPGSAK